MKQRVSNTVRGTETIAKEEAERKLATMQPYMMHEAIERVRDMLGKDAKDHVNNPIERVALARCAIAALRGLGFLTSTNAAHVPERHL